MKYIFFSLVCFLSVFSLRAQDRIVTIHGDEIVGKIVVIDTASVHYFPIDTTSDNPAIQEIHIINKSDIFMITYANGSKDVFTENLPGEKPEEASNNNATYNDNYLLGEQDAKQRFDGSGAFVAGFIGLIPGVIVTVSTPQIRPSKVSDPSLITDASYRRGYKKAASNKKLQNAAAGYAAGRIATILLLIAIALTF
ncbi:MAG: hypothetical protein ACXWDO_06245 [Bacteroidia bacterium]